MNRGAEIRDLIVLVADVDIEQAVKGLPTRREVLRIRSVDYEIRRHLNRDGGCRTGAADYLRLYLKSYRHSLLIFDRDGRGGGQSRAEIQQEVEFDLMRNGWEDRSKVIIIDPELEICVWSNSPRVSEILGWGSNFSGLRDLLRSRGLWSPDLQKPEDPKKAMLEAMEKGELSKRARRSPAKFNQLAKTVSFARCREPPLVDLRGTLHTWFPAAGQ